MTMYIGLSGLRAYLLARPSLLSSPLLQATSPTRREIYYNALYNASPTIDIWFVALESYALYKMLEHRAKKSSNQDIKWYQAPFVGVATVIAISILAAQSMNWYFKPTINLTEIFKQNFSSSQRADFKIEWGSTRATITQYFSAIRLVSNLALAFLCPNRLVHLGTAFLQACTLTNLLRSHWITVDTPHEIALPEKFSGRAKFEFFIPPYHSYVAKNDYLTSCAKTICNYATHCFENSSWVHRDQSSKFFWEASQYYVSIEPSSCASAVPPILVRLNGYGKDLQHKAGNIIILRRDLFHRIPGSETIFKAITFLF